MNVAVNIGLMAATVGGTVDAITATYTPTVTALVDKMILGFRATGSNSVTNPTFSPDGESPHTITMLGGGALVPGSIAGSDYDCLVIYNSSSATWELVNPAIVFGSTAGTVAQGNKLPKIIIAQTTNGNPTDGSLAYFGGIPDIPVISATANRRTSVPFGATNLRGIRLSTIVTTPSTAETGTMDIRINNTTNTQILTGLTWDVTARISTNDAINLTVSDSSYFELVVNYPTWPGSNPGGVKYYAELYFE